MLREYKNKTKIDVQKILGVLFLCVFVIGNMDVFASQKTNVQKHESETLDLLSRIDAFAETDERIRLDAARAHYNMGNIYFQKGQYEIAAREYFHAATLMPNDPDVHYNLAFVHGEKLKDFKTALKHYRMYLYLNPKAADKEFIKTKIVDAELRIRATVDSPLEGKSIHK
jgi:tetratricopeptide (TPR) repeat protein